MTEQAPRIALAPCKDHPGFIAGDDAPLVRAFKDAGCACELVRWDDPKAGWERYDGVIIRSTWDYQERLDEYLAWAERAASQTTLLNPLAVVRQNIRKTYLQSLQEQGVPIVPTRWLDESSSLERAIDDAGWTDAIIKPAIGAGASGLVRFSTTNANDLARVRAHAERCINSGLGPMLIQPWLPTIVDAGETSVVVIDGEVSHAVRKVPAGDDFRVQIEFGGTYTVVEPTESQREIALASWDAANDPASPLLYARVDLVEPEPGEPAVIELELIEPELFFPITPGAADRFAVAALRRLKAAPAR